MTGWVAGWGGYQVLRLVIRQADRGRPPATAGEDPGATGRQTGLKEKDVNLDISLRLGKLLREMGAKVVFTRESDTFIPLYDRPALANRLHADLFLSVHADSTAKRDINGVSTYYYQSSEPSRQGLFDRSMSLAEDVQSSLISGLSITDRGGQEEPRYRVRGPPRKPDALDPGRNRLPLQQL